MRRLRRGRRLLSSDAPFASKNTTRNPCVENAHPAVIGRQRVASSSRRQWKVTRVHTACQTNTPVDVLDTLVERNAATRHMAQFATAVVVRRPSSPVRCNSRGPRWCRHSGCSFNQDGASPSATKTACLSLSVVRYLILRFPGSVAMRTNTVIFPCMMVAKKASLGVLYEIVRASPVLARPR